MPAILDHVAVLVDASEDEEALVEVGHDGKLSGLDDVVY